MRLIFVLIFLVCGIYSTNAQQPIDTLAAVYKPYQSAMGILLQSHRAMPQDSLAIAKERHSLQTNYKRTADSLQLHAEKGIAVEFEAQRLMDAISYRQNDAQLNEVLINLYDYANAHQKILIEENQQLKKLAQCIMGINPAGVLDEKKIIQHNAERIQDFYKHIDTGDWSEEMQQRFINFFAGQYMAVGSVSKTEKVYRYFDAMFLGDAKMNDLKSFSLPDSLRFQNGNMALTPKNWSGLAKEKIVVQLSGNRLFDFVYLVSLLRAVNTDYANKYDVLLLRSSYSEHNAYLSNVKENLAFDDYYIATVSAKDLNTTPTLPAVFIVNADNEVSYQASHTNILFKKLNTPIEAAKALAEEERQAGIKQKKAALEQRVIRTKDSINYKKTHQKIRLRLKGVWEEDLSMQLTPLQWNEKDSLSDATYPYMAKLEVMHPQYKAYELLVLVTGKRQKITITSGDLYKKTVSYAKAKNAKFHDAIQNIEESLSKQVNYAYMQKNYPFQESDFIAYLTEQLEKAKKQEQIAISSVKNATDLLQRYAELKRK